MSFVLNTSLALLVVFVMTLVGLDLGPADFASFGVVLFLAQAATLVPLAVLIAAWAGGRRLA